MTRKSRSRPGVSAAPGNGPAAGDTNDCCHSWTGGVEQHDKHVLRAPQVVLVLWDHYYRTNPDAQAFAQQLVSDLVGGPFMNGLAQYGVGHGALNSTIVIDTDAINPAPDSWDGKSDSDKKQINAWLKDQNHTLSPSPAENEASLLFLLFLPRKTQLTYGKNKDGTPNTNVCGWHWHDKFNPNSQNDDLFWALVKTDTAAAGATEREFVNSVAPCVSHELAELFTDRDGDGYSSTCSDGKTNCEIGDICELNKYQYQRPGSLELWSVQQYWSGWDNACINGNLPVSIKRFLMAIGFDYHTKGLAALGIEDINLEYVASQM